jgi:drug/metabolite transporter superfamily protein YnfA
MWMMIVERERATVWDVAGVALCVNGTLVIYFGNRVPA